MVTPQTDERLRTLMLGALKGGTAVVLATVNEDGTPTTAINTWVVAKNESTVAFAVDSRSSAFVNISAGRRRVAFELLADDLILAVRGTATIVKNRLESVPFPCALAHIAVESIREHMLPELRFQGPRYSYSLEKGHRTNAEAAIYAELAKDIAQ
jgi:pyridoxamine 5'-phosphate oxidase-like protein